MSKQSINTLIEGFETMLYNRKDISDWVIHFVHDRHPADDMYVLTEIAKREAEIDGVDTYGTMVHYFDADGKSHDMSEPISDEEYPIAEDAKAFDVLLKIVHDGFIRSGWSLRDGNATIYGPYSAVCFTEMPLYALLDYSQIRGGKDGYVGSYGIAFRKKELFKAGARPVIYGLSGTHQEVDGSHDWYKYGIRVLHPNCGIGLQEQYRYVHTNFNRTTPIDWTHEREWRWALRNGDSGIGGMPFLLSEEWGPLFTEILLIVQTEIEQVELLNLIKGMYDAKSTNSGRDYNTTLLPAIKVISLESLALADVDLQSVRIEDIPYKQMKIMPEIKVSEEMRIKVKQYVPAAEQKGVEAIVAYKKLHPEHITKDFDWGHVHACTNEISEVTQALLEEGLAYTFSDGKYIIFIGKGDWPYDDSTLLYIGARATAEYLTQIFGQRFYPEVTPD